MFTAKVKTDGRLFMGYIERGTWVEAHVLEAGKEYCGIVFDSAPTRTHYVEYEGSEIAFFKSDELEDVPHDLQLILLARQA